MRAHINDRTRRHCLGLVTALAAVITWGDALAQAEFDLCGCEDPERVPLVFDSNDPSSWPMGSSHGACPGSGYVDIYIRLPEDGVLVYDEFIVNNTDNWCIRSSGPANRSPRINFIRNARNTPVTLLVAGNATISRGRMILSGQSGVYGTTQPTPGRGGAPGPGGYRGGDGGWVDIKGVGDGGEGLGPSGGLSGEDGRLPDFSAPGPDAARNGGYGAFPGPDTLLPLIGGSGGGGGASKDHGDCGGGGGGGGGGALAMVVNGTLHFGSFQIYADGGGRGEAPACGTYGGWGSGGAIRLVAHTTSGNADLLAQGGGNTNPGVIRIEAIHDSLGGTHQPLALRPGHVSHVTNPLASWVRIASVDGQSVPEALSGPAGGMDIMVPGPGVVPIVVETAGVPAGTTVQLTAKPKVGGPAIVDEQPLEVCDPSGNGECSREFDLYLVGGAYFVEALATFKAP